MTAKSKWRGDEIEYTDGEYIFSDTKEAVAETYTTRPCGHCGRQETAQGHDACLGTLIGVVNACCGHGDVAEAYIQLEDGQEIRGQEAVNFQKTTRKAD